MKLINTGLALMLMACMGGFASCSSDDNPSLPDENAQPYDKLEPLPPNKAVAFTESDIEHLAILDRMAFTLYNAINDNDAITDTQNGNFCLSPASAAICFTLYANSIDNPWRDQVVNSLGFKSIDEMNTLTTKLLTYLPADETGVLIKLANSVWVNNKYTISKDYKQFMQSTFRSPVSPLDISDNGHATGIINQWCKDNTEGLIKEIIDKLPEDLGVFWANALYFQGAWADKFDKTKTTKATFHGADGDTQADMMRMCFVPKYATIGKSTIVSLPFSGDTYSLDIIIGDNALTMSEYLTLKAAAEPALVDLSLPRFTAGCNTDLIKVYPGLYNASINSTLGTVGLPMSYTTEDVKALQKTAFVVNEDGAEGATVTEIHNSVAAGPEDELKEPISVVIDKPFNYVVRNNATGTIIFIGRVNNL